MTLNNKQLYLNHLLISIILMSVIMFSVMGISKAADNPWLPYSNPSSILNPVSICFLNNSIGWILCDTKGFYQTKDGGTTWSLYSLSTVYKNLKTFAAFDETHWVIGGKNVILLTSDAGQTWSATTDTTMDIYRFDILDAQKAYAAGSKGLILYTQDGGMTWSEWSKDTGVYSGIAHGPSTNPMAVGYVTDTCDGVDFEPDPDFWYISPDAWGYYAKGSQGSMSITTVHHKLSDIQFVNSSTGWISATVCDYYPYWAFAGWIGLFYASAPSFEYSSLYYYTHFNYRTVDGGVTWAPCLIGYETTNNVVHDEVKLDFVNEKIGYALVRNAAYLYRTVDGGINWSPISVPSPALYLKDVYFTDALNGWLVGQDKAGTGFIWKTSNGGNTWVKVIGGHIPAYTTINDLAVAGDGSIYAVADNAYVYGKPATEDNWYCCWVGYRVNEVFSIGHTGVGYLNQYDCWRLTDDGWRSTKLMNLWDDASDRSMDNYLNWDMYFYNRDTGWACSGKYPNGNYQESIRKTVDGGVTWTTLTCFNNLNYHPYKLFFLDSQNGWVLCEYQQMIFRTRDSGTTWSPQSVSNLGVTGYLRDIYFKDLQKGWVVSSDGYILRTFDGGSTWEVQNGSPYPFALKKICFANAYKGFIIGASGHLLGTLDGGENWTQLTPSLSGDIQDIVFDHNGTGWMALSGSSNLIYYLPKDDIYWNPTAVSRKEWECLE